LIENLSPPPPSPPLQEEDVADSPPTRRPPEVKTHPINSVKVMPNDEMSLEEKRRSLKPIPSMEDPLLAFAERGNLNGLEEMSSQKTRDDKIDAPPTRPPPPPEQEEVPTKILTLKERMSKLQSKVQPPQPQVEDEPPPPARPAAPRNYINDMRSRGGPKNELYAQNIVTPSPEFPEITRINKPVCEDVDEPQMNGESEPIVIATARGLFDHRGGLLESVETNVSIFIPYGALPEGKKEEIYFKVCQDSQHMPPLDSHSGETLLSPLVMCGPHGLKFNKPIELRLPHKGAGSNDSMAFSLKSSDSPVGQPGDWRNVPPQSAH
jgi:tight junction protein 1